MCTCIHVYTYINVHTRAKKKNILSIQVVSISGTSKTSSTILYICVRIVFLALQVHLVHFCGSSNEYCALLDCPSKSSHSPMSYPYLQSISAEFSEKPRVYWHFTLILPTETVILQTSPHGVLQGHHGAGAGAATPWWRIRHCATAVNHWGSHFRFQMFQVTPPPEGERKSQELRAFWGPASASFPSAIETGQSLGYPGKDLKLAIFFIIPRAWTLGVLQPRLHQRPGGCSELIVSKCGEWDQHSSFCWQKKTSKSTCPMVKTLYMAYGNPFLNGNIWHMIGCDNPLSPAR